MSTLPKLRVRTEHSAYEIDQVAGTYTRTRVHEDANDLSRYGVEDAQPVEYQEIASELTVGSRMVIMHEGGKFLYSTPIVSVEEL